MSTYKKTVYTSLKLHLDRHKYKRGANKGDAPLEKRAKTHLRVAERHDHMAVRFYNTDILKAYPDGSITIDCDGWEDRPTTRQALNGALGVHGADVSIGSRSFFGKSQTIMYSRSHGGRSFVYYDGISFDANGSPTTPLRPFKAKRIDKDQVAELNQDMNEHGFKEMFKVWWGACEYEESQGPDHQWRYVAPVQLLSDPDKYAAQWRAMVAHFTWDLVYVYNGTVGQYGNRVRVPKRIKHDASEAWAALMSWCKRNMYEIVETEVYER